MGDKMLYADLHIHSNYSDGRLSPEEIVNLSIQKDIKCISITDHDTIDSQYIVKKFSSDKKITLVSGLELSSQYKDIEIHILAYFIDINNRNLKINLDEIKNSRQERAKQIIENLNKIDVNISFDEISSESFGDSIGRVHIAKLLVKKGYAAHTKEAFQRYLIKGRPAFVERCKIDYKEALKLINDANGVAVLAHPGEIYKNIMIEKIIKDLKIYGLKGIEVFHPAHSSMESSKYYSMAKKYSLVITGGSDSHGTIVNGDYTLGTIGMDKTLTCKFLDYDTSNNS